MNRTRYTFTPLTVCTDCLMLIANGDTPDNLDEDQTDAWVTSWERRTDVFETISAGHLDPNDDDAGSDPCWTWTDEEYCTCDGWFSWGSCDTCGTTLGGTRHPAVGHETTSETVTS